jgi:hypothetical protein
MFRSQETSQRIEVGGLDRRHSKKDEGKTRTEIGVRREIRIEVRIEIEIEVDAGTEMRAAVRTNVR